MSDLDLAGHDHESGTMARGCERCRYIARHQCRWCGYGHAFTTHSPFAHLESGDPVAVRLALETGHGETAWFDRFDVYLPYDEGNRSVVGSTRRAE